MYEQIESINKEKANQKKKIGALKVGLAEMK